jgi:CRISPR system Cascade subunit CasE
MRAFPGESDGGPGRVLFRLDLPREEGFSIVLVQSEKSPDWSYLVKNYLLDNDLHQSNPDWKEIDPEIAPGQILAFRLRANPTKREAVKRENGKCGKRIGLLRPEDQIEWIKRKGEQGGFTILQVVPIREKLHQGKKSTTGRSHKLSLLSVRFEGVLRVDDPALFRQSLKSGIGPGKGLGFGLLSIARA